jgi:general stress protein YciG
MQKKSALSRAASLIGRAGGKRCLETMTPEQRSERARKAGQASGKARAKMARAKRKKG